MSKHGARKTTVQSVTLTVLSILCYAAAVFCALFVFFGAWPLLAFSAFFIFIGIFAWKHRFDGSGNKPTSLKTPVDEVAIQAESTNTIPVPSKSHVAGTVEHTVYNYNEPVVANIPRDKIFTAGIIRRKTNVPFHGNKDFDYILGGGNGNGYVLSYHGFPFGVVFDDRLCAYLDDVHARTISCVWHEWYEPTIKSIKALAPSTRRSRSERIIASMIGAGKWDSVDDVDSIKASDYKPNAMADSLLSGRGFIDIEVSLDMIPTPKGSYAKPHVGIFRDGAALFEFDARKMVYRELVRHAGQNALARVEKKLSNDGNGSPYYSIMLVFQSDTSSQARLLQSHVGIADNR